MLRKISGNDVWEFHEKMYRPYIRELGALGGGDGFSLGTMIHGLCDGGLEIYSVRIDNEDIGFVITEQVGQAMLSTPMLFIAEFCIAHKYRRRGIGTAVFGEILDKTERPVFLTVLPANHGAAAFWERQAVVYDLKRLKPEAKQIQFAGDSKLLCFSKKDS